MNTNYLSQQVTTIIDQLHGHFDQIGISSEERESRESEVQSHARASATLNLLIGMTALFGALQNPRQPA